MTNGNAFHLFTECVETIQFILKNVLKDVAVLRRWCGCVVVNENHVINSIKFCVNRVSRVRQQAFNETFIASFIRFRFVNTLVLCAHKTFLSACCCWRVCARTVGWLTAHMCWCLCVCVCVWKVSSLIASGRRLYQIVIICILLFAATLKWFAITLARRVRLILVLLMLWFYFTCSHTGTFIWWRGEKKSTLMLLSCPYPTWWKCWKFLVQPRHVTNGGDYIFCRLCRLCSELNLWWN